MSAIPMAGVLAGAPKTQTVRDFDTAKITEMSQGLLFEVLPALYMHFVKKAGGPLLLVPLMGVLNKIRSPMFRIHLLGMT